jgi:CysZ protein
MIYDLARALGILNEPRARNVLLLGVGLALGTLAVLVVGLNWLLALAAETGYLWLDRVVEVLGVLGTLVVAWFLFPPVVVAVSSLFLERVVAITEERHYPALPPPRAIPIGEGVTTALRLLGLSLLLNLLALPLYFVPLVNLPLWLLLNGWLVGREYAELVGLRRVDPRTLDVLRRQQRGVFWTSGMAIAFLLSLPLVNLVAPIVGAAFMTHRFHRYCDELALRVPRTA